PLDIPAERLADLVPDGRIHLAGDLGNGQSVTDDQVELDREAVPDGDMDPARCEAEPLREPADRAPAGEADHAVRTQRRGADDVDHRPPRHQRAAGRGYGPFPGHAAGIL